MKFNLIIHQFICQHKYIMLLECFNKSNNSFLPPFLCLQPPPNIIVSIHSGVMWHCYLHTKEKGGGIWPYWHTVSSTSESNVGLLPEIIPCIFPLDTLSTTFSLSRVFFCHMTCMGQWNSSLSTMVQRQKYIWRRKAFGWMWNWNNAFCWNFFSDLVLFLN